MDIRFLIVGAPFIVSFFYTLFWLKRWGAFNSSTDDHTKKIMTIKDEQSSEGLILEKIFLTKN